MLLAYQIYQATPPPPPPPPPSELQQGKDTRAVYTFASHEALTHHVVQADVAGQTVVALAARRKHGVQHVSTVLKWE